MGSAVGSATITAPGGSRGAVIAVVVVLGLLAVAAVLALLVMGFLR